MTEKKDGIGIVEGVKNLIKNAITPGKDGPGSYSGAGEEAESGKTDSGRKNPMPAKLTSARSAA